MELLTIHHDEERLKEVRIQNTLQQMTKAQLVEKVREVQKRNEILEQDNADLHARMQEYLNRESAYWKTDEDGVVRCSKCHRKAPKDKTTFWGEQYHPTKYCMFCGSVMRFDK